MRQQAALFYCFLLFLLLTDSCVPDLSRSFIAVKPGLQPVLLVGVDGEAPSPSSAFPGAEFLFALIPHSLLCLFVQIKRSVNNPSSYLFMAVLFVMNWAGASQRGEAVLILVPSQLLPCFQWDGSAGETFPWMFASKEMFKNRMEAHPTTVVVSSSSAVNQNSAKAG